MAIAGTADPIWRQTEPYAHPEKGKPLNIYRLAAIAPGDPSWRLSNEKETVWACAPDAGLAREMVAARTFVTETDRQGDKSPWRDELVTSCILDPTMSLMRAGTVVRQDGSAVGESA